MSQELYEVFDDHGAKGKTVARLDRASLGRLLEGTFRIYKGGSRWFQRCDWVRIYERAPHGPWAVRIDQQEGSTIDFPVKLGSKDGVPLWLHGSIRNLLEAFVFVMPAGQTGPGRSCARIWLALYAPGSASPRPDTYSFRNTGSAPSATVVPCEHLILTSAGSAATRRPEDAGPQEDDEAEGYHED